MRIGLATAVLAATLIESVATTSWAQVTTTWQLDLEQAKADARRLGKPILLVFR